MAGNKTRPTDDSVDDYLASIEDEERRDDCRTLVAMLREITGEKPVMWGNIVGFGSYHYRYASGREDDWPIAGFASRKRDLTIYIMAGFEKYRHLLARLGKHKTGVSCLYVKRLSDVDTDVLRELMAASVDSMRAS